MNKTLFSTATLMSLASLFAISAQAQTVTSYSGDAFVIRTDELGDAPIFGDTGPLPAAGGSLTGSLGNFGDVVGLVSLSGGTSATSGGGGNANSSATLGAFNFNAFGDTISFDGLTALSHADAGGVTGSVLFTNLFVDGVAYTTPVAPNTVIPLTGVGGTITLNKQTKEA